ncbi:protein MpR2R3-MYB16 [Marchantia polymorpha subsp. ruderalis]|uniref:Uncharacterized protein n=2 Tax=Marchantia polymorpha TaxID=3197 RepID=A0AAF6BHT6_MARPO|nr:hypothetical protein MARPO_0092s0005 [Marchantia polymorpha]BBN11570.1 hypothetical protein Mp_5g13030 [Marchantia polymorpha subsp. ruderalis]|eukprot:PTQ33031.1 hypothetical protein MARPO_0092s0005 [Marchantia polymorpha]
MSHGSLFFFGELNSMTGDNEISNHLYVLTPRSIHRPSKICASDPSTGSNLEKMEGSSLTLPKLPLRRCLQDISNSSEPNLPSAAVVDFPLDKKGKKQRVYQLRPRKPSTVWTTEDDETLQAAVEKFKGGNWKKIAASLPNRSDDQCLHRWQKVLRPTLVKGYWNKEEDDELLELVHKFGTKSWAAIARSLPGRTGKQCRESCVSKMVLIYMFPYLIFSAKYTIDGNFEVHV